jgi:hypothetical protein
VRLWARGLDTAGLPCRRPAAAAIITAEILIDGTVPPRAVVQGRAFLPTGLQR